MSRRAAGLIGWGMIAAVAAICFGLNQLRAQYLYFNWFVTFTFGASALLVGVLWLLARRTRGRAADQIKGADETAEHRG